MHRADDGEGIESMSAGHFVFMPRQCVKNPLSQPKRRRSGTKSIDFALARKNFLHIDLEGDIK